MPDSLLTVKEEKESQISQRALTPCQNSLHSCSPSCLFLCCVVLWELLSSLLITPVSAQEMCGHVTRAA